LLGPAAKQWVLAHPSTAFADEVTDNSEPAGQNPFGRDDGLAEDAAVENVADDFELGEFGHETSGGASSTYRYRNQRF